MPRLIVKSLKALAGILLIGTVSIWLIFKFTNIVPDDIQDYVKGVILGRHSPLVNRTPGEIIRHAKQRLDGHPTLEIIALPLLDFVQPIYERRVPEIPLPLFGKGQQQLSILSNRTAEHFVRTTAELEQAIYIATEGQVIEMLPGVYRINRALKPRNPGASGKEIILRAMKPGSVTIEVAANEAFQVYQPYWTFENLKIIGVCQDDDSCEHAIHVMGGAHHTVIVNNHIEDFSAHIKINGDRDVWPDDGAIKSNTLINSHARNTNNPVTPVDIVGASHWVVTDNYVANFIKLDPKSTTYGIFMKGAGFGGRIERNVVVCSLSDISRAGSRVAISFGGGETGPSYCRDHECKSEFKSGRAVNNIVAHCNDFGIEVTRAESTLIAQNTLVNTAGIEVKGDASKADVFGNHLEGVIRARKGGISIAEANEIGRMSDFFVAPDQLNLGWKQFPEKIPSYPVVAEDICQQPRKEETLPGALEAGGPC